MDFRSFSRRELQALCKRNKIPANITNVAMADALAALPLVEGIDEFLNGEGSGIPESPMREEIACSENPRTALRSSTRRKAVKDESKSSQPMTRTRRAAAARCTEESENTDLNVALTTPSLPTGRRRTSAAATSACKKVDFQMTVDVQKEDKDLDQEKNVIEKTPAVPKSQKRVAAASTRKKTEVLNDGATEQRVYSTRRSVRLLEKNMESLSLADDGKMETVAVHMSFDEMPNSTGSLKEDTNLGIESKIKDESDSKLDEDLELGDIAQEKNEMESESNLPEAEPEMNPDSSIHSAENLVAKICDESETDVAAPDDKLDMKCFSEVEVSEETPKDVDTMEISADEINDSGKVSLPAEVPDEAPKDNDDAVEELSLPTEDVDLTEVHNLANVGESNTEVESLTGDDSEEEAAKIMNNSAELCLPHENVEEKTQVDEVEESVNETEPTIGEDVDNDGEEEEEALERVSVEAEDDTMKSMDEFPQNVSEDLVDVKIQWPMEEEAPKDENDSEPKIPNDINFEVVEVSVVTSTEEIPTSSSSSKISGAVQLGTQFPRPSVNKSPLKQQTITGLLMDQSDAEEEDEKEKEKVVESCAQRQIVVEKNDLSLRQLKKMFKEKLQLSNKNKMDNAKVGDKVRTALQPLPENRMAMDELEKRF